MTPTESKSANTTHPAKGKRSKSGCLTCRKRKKKCDETLCPETGGCWRCRNAGYQCEEFRRPLVVYERGASAASSSRLPKRIKQSPEAGLSASPLSDNKTPQTSTSNGTLQHETASTLSIPNSLVEFAGLATSNDAWALLEAIPSSVTPDIGVHVGDFEPLLSPNQQHQPHQALVRSCEIVGDCLFSGRHLCTACSAVASRLVDPGTSDMSALSPIFASIPSLSTPAISRHPSPGPSDEHLAATSPGQVSSRKSQTILESLIGYYSTLITCWAQGCDAKGLEGSTLFPKLVPYLLDRINKDPPLRLSIAAVTAGYIGGSRLTWPPDVVAIHKWASILRADRASIADCVRANATFPRPETPDTAWSASPGDSLASDVSSRLPIANRRRRSTLATLDDLLVGQAETLKHLAICSLDEAISEYCARTMRVPGLGLTEKGFLAEVSKINSLLLTSVNLAIYTFAEESVESYFEEGQRMRNLVENTLGTFPPVNLSKLCALDHLGFRTYVWCDVGTAIARGTLPHVQLTPIGALTELSTVDSPNLLESVFSLPDSLMIALSEIARLRIDYDGGDYTATARRSVGVAVPAWVHARADKIISQVRSTNIPSRLSAGSATCAQMIREACLILIYTLIYRVGSLHSVIRQSLSKILEMWSTSGEQYCRSVGCSNYNIPMFIAASVAIDARDRTICAKAMQIVGHEESAPASGRALIHKLWTTTDTTGVPCFWTDLVASGEHSVAFF